MAKFYHGEVKTENVYESDRKAESIAAKVADELVKLGGGIDVGRMFGDGPTVLIVKLPDDLNLNPDELVGEGIVFHQVGFMAAPAVPDHGIPSDQGAGPA